MRKAGDAASEPTFEERLKALEEVVARLEREDVPLEEAIRLYEEGVKLHAACEKTLGEARLRIEKLAEASGGGDGSG